MSTLRLYIKNKKALWNYEVLETVEAGIELTGSEVKSIRARNVSISNSYIAIKLNMECFLLGAHIKKYSFDTQNNKNMQYNPDRPRKLLLHKKQIIKFQSKSREQGMAIIPTSIYINRRNLVKIEIALAKGKKLHDKRRDLKDKAIQLREKQSSSS